MSRRLERRNIYLFNEENQNENGDTRSELDAKNHRSPNRQVITYKTETKNSNAKVRYNAEGVEESFNDQQDDDIDQADFNRVFRDTNVDKPFGQINRNVGPENKRSNQAVLPNNIKAKRLEQLNEHNNFNGKESENYDASCSNNIQDNEPTAQQLNSKKMLNSYKSQVNIKSKCNLNKSPSQQFMKIKKRMEKEIKNPDYVVYQHKIESDFSSKRSGNTKAKKSPDSKSIKQFRSNSPNIRFLPNNPQQNENAMDAYRMKKLQESLKSRKKSIDIANLENSSKIQDEIKEFSKELPKTNIPRPSVNQHKFRNEYRTQHDLLHTEIKNVDSIGKESIAKLNEKAKYTSPKFKAMVSGSKITYEDALAYSSGLSQSKSYKFLSPNHYPVKSQQDGYSHLKNRKNSQKIDPSTKDKNNIFERLFNENEEKKLKLETLKEEYHVRQLSAEKSSHSKERIAKKDNSVPPDEFYNKQMRLKIDAEKKLAIKMQEKTQLQSNENKSKIKKSRSRKRSEVSNNEKHESNVYNRLFNDVRERSRKRLVNEAENATKHYESVGNISLSSLSKQDGIERRINNGVNDNAHIPSINKKSKRLITPKRDK